MTIPLTMYSTEELADTDRSARIIMANEANEFQSKTLDAHCGPTETRSRPRISQIINLFNAHMLIYSDGLAQVRGDS